MSEEAHAAVAPRSLRKDAERNRVRILASAKVLFAERGVDVGLDEIADHAGVGVGTVYRRFPDREVLVDELLEEKTAAIEAIAADALEIDDPWEGLVAFLVRSQEMQAADRGLKQALLVPTRGAERLAAARARIEPLVSRLIERARRSGDLRSDLRFEDFPMLVEMISAVSVATHAHAPDLWRRYLGIVIDGLATSRERPTELGAPALAREDLIDSLCNSASR